MSIPYTNRQWRSRLAILLVSLASAGHCLAWPSSAESNVLDLRLSMLDTFFSAESNIFSLDGQESEYTFNLSATYSTAQQLFRVTAYVYDRGSGAVVSSGAGTFRVTQGGQTLASGALTYASGSRLWDSGTVPLTAADTLGVQVTVNGRTSATFLLIPSSAPVHLAGWAKQDNGTGINGGTVRLYNASTVFSATDLNNLPAPLASRTTISDGSFDFSDWQVGQYVLTLQTGNGTTIGAAFWLRNGETTHSETIIEDPGRTELLNGFLTLRQSIESRIVDQQTTWMKGVADTVDADIDATPDLIDWCLFLGNLTSGTAINLYTAWHAGLSLSHFVPIIQATTAESLSKELPKLGVKLSVAGGTMAAEDLASIATLNLAAKAALMQPYFAYGGLATQELTEIDEALAPDVKALLDPRLSTPVLNMTFSRDNRVRQHSFDWYSSLKSYEFAERWLTTYSSQAVQGTPALPGTFSLAKAKEIVRGAENQLQELQAGTRLLFVSANPSEWTPTTAAWESDTTPMAPLPLNLLDYYQKYQIGRVKKDVASWIGKGSSAVSLGAGGLAAASAAGIVSIPASVPLGAIAGVARLVNIGASVAQAGIKTDMAATYTHMSAKYPANMLTAPLVLKRTTDFIIGEAATPYYLNANNRFGGAVGSVNLGGIVIFGQEMFFPVQLTLLPFLPPIQFTSENSAQVSFAFPAGTFSTAHCRIETIVLDFSGAHDHVVINGGELVAGQSGHVQTPFRGHLRANGVMSAGTFVSRLWVGPFQKSIKTKEFYVSPINIRLSPLPFGAQETREEMQKPLGFVKMERRALSGEEILTLSDRVRERVETNLVIGANSFTREYAFPTNIFSAEFRLYRPVGASVAFRVEKDGEYIGWDETAGVTHQGFPGEHSGNEANPETITIPNIGGQTVTVHVALGAVETEPVSVLLEAWEQPERSAVLAVLPDAVNSISRTGITHVVEVAIGESSHQHPLESVSFSASPLRSATATVLNWSTVSWVGTTNIPAAGLQTCSMELDTRGVEDGTYTGTVTVSSANAGTVSVPVSITVDGQAPAITIQPIREWWFNPIGPVVTWTGQDNVTAGSNLLYSYILEPLDGSWSGYIQTTNRDLSGVADGNYLLSVLARDQALNETQTPAGTVIRIDRAGNLWKQRIVDADLDDEITNVGQVSWNDDFDGDGASNLMEYYAGTDPTNPGDLFAFAQANASQTGFVIHWKAKRGVTYQVRRTTNLVTGPWEDAPTDAGADQRSLVTAPADGEQVYRDATPITGPVFYKIDTME